MSFALWVILRTIVSFGQRNRKTKRNWRKAEAESSLANVLTFKETKPQTGQRKGHSTQVNGDKMNEK